MSKSGITVDNKKLGDRVFNPLVWEQSCAQLLNYLGFPAVDGRNMPSPLREDSDSDSFSINDNLWYDHKLGKGGNPYELSLALHSGRKLDAVRVLHEAAGVAFTRETGSTQFKSFKLRELGIELLERIRQKYSIDPFNPSPQHTGVDEYLRSRGVSERTMGYFSYVPAGGLSEIMSSDEADLIGGPYALEEKIILWYLKNKRPVYFVTREIVSKKFAKASLKNGVLQHPIWNVDDLYSKESVIWCEGMFDAMALAECGYGVAGEITCNLSSAHEGELLKALRWRIKNHNSWSFTICLDDDAVDSTGVQRGNVAAEKIALFLLKNNIDVLWVKHPTGEDATDQKIDLSNIFNVKSFTPSGDVLLNKDGIDKVIGAAKLVSEHLAGSDGQDIILRQLHDANVNLDLKRVENLYNILETTHGLAVSDIVKKIRQMSVSWRDVYTDEIEDICMYGSDYYVLYSKNIYGGDEGYSSNVFKANCFRDNLRQYQKDPQVKYQNGSILVPKKRPTWFVTNKNESSNPNIFNLYRPTPTMLQVPVPGTPIPKPWDLLLDNLASPEEKDWLLNHMAYYVQTFEKPITIPAFLGGQGTGKTAFIKVFGLCIGKFTPIDNDGLSSSFNDYLESPCILLDELSSAKFDATKIKNKIKGMINETHVINRKFQAPYTINSNSYVAIASNEFLQRLPFVIEDGDRRFTIISGGKNIKFNDCESNTWSYDAIESTKAEFYLYLISRPYDKALAQSVLTNALKEDLIERGEDSYSHLISDYMERLKNGTVSIDSENWFGPIDDPNRIYVAKICDLINDCYKIRSNLSLVTRKAKPYLVKLGYDFKYHHHKAYIKVDFNMGKGGEVGDITEVESDGNALDALDDPNESKDFYEKLISGNDDFGKMIGG